MEILIGLFVGQVSIYLLAKICVSLYKDIRKS